MAENFVQFLLYKHYVLFIRLLYGLSIVRIQNVTQKDGKRSNDYRISWLGAQVYGLVDAESRSKCTTHQKG
ncbi:hypothetical protein ACIOBL_19085 [Paenibacillus taichungensis]|uniref:hypothetical protein n=1 Tax=Paenibacillus taichungensis TaxID=484184 RepID=UPI003830979B